MKISDHALCSCVEHYTSQVRLHKQTYYTLLGGCYVYSSTINQCEGDNIHGG